MKNYLSLVMPVLVTALSCTGLKDLYESGGEKVDVDGTLSHGMIVLGEQLEDPYELKNVTEAVKQLYPTKAASVLLDATDLYVRFLPGSADDFDLLASMGVELIDHPMDYEVLLEGDYYHDPSIPDDEATWQYAVVPPGFSFPDGIRYEVLHECYIAEHDIALRSSGIDWAEVERLSFKLTGNEAMLCEGTRAKNQEYRKPEGRIAIDDKMLDDEPFGVKGVRVSCNVFVKTATAITDDEGYYKMDKSFSAKPRYRLVFKNEKGFTIGFNSIIVPSSTSTLGQASPEGVSCHIGVGSDKALWRRCIVNNAAYDYYNACQSPSDKIKLPPKNLRIWILGSLEKSSAVMLQHGTTIDQNLIEGYLGDFMLIARLFLPDITLGLRYSESYDDIYSTTIHELAHASHFMQVGKDYWNRVIKNIMTSFITSFGVTYGVGTEEDCGYTEVTEMWAYYVQTRLYRQRYPDSSKSFGATFWFSPQIFNYLDERGLDMYKIFSALQPDVIDKQSLKARLLMLYPEFKDVINKAFQRYI